MLSMFSTMPASDVQRRSKESFMIKASRRRLILRYANSSGWNDKRVCLMLNIYCLEYAMMSHRGPTTFLFYFIFSYQSNNYEWKMPIIIQTRFHQKKEFFQMKYCTLKAFMVMASCSGTLFILPGPSVSLIIWRVKSERIRYWTPYKSILQQID